MSYEQREPPVLALLCSLLVEETYGNLAARVFSILARHGRQTLAGIARASYLSGKQIKPGLVVLVQQHLIFHSSLDPQVTYYEIDWQQSYALVRHGKILKMAEERFGRKTANVLANMLSLGHTRLADLKEAYFPSTDKVNGEFDEAHANGTGSESIVVNGANGVSAKSKETERLTNGVKHVNGHSDASHNTVNHSKKGTDKAVIEQDEDENDTVDDEAENERETDDKIESVSDLYEIIDRLGSAGWIFRIDPDQYLSPGDFHTLAQQQAYDLTFPDGKVPNGTKDQERWDFNTRDLKRQIRDEWHQPPKFEMRKRKPSDEDCDRSSKRQKVNGTYAPAASGPNGDDASYTRPVDEDLNLRVNFDKISVALRTEQLTRFVEGRLGPTTAQVYHKMLCILEKHLPRCYEPWPEPSNKSATVVPEVRVDEKFLVSAREVALALDRDIDLFEGLDPEEVVVIMARSEAKHHHIKPPIDPASATLDERTRLVNCHIRLLANDGFRFATWQSRSGGGQYQVQYDEIAKATIQLEIENAVAASKGNLGVKLIRALKRHGKLDERETCNAMMMTAADIRETVNDLTVKGVVQTQEIPRVDRREAKLSLHLTWYDRQRAREKLLHDAYMGMVRTIQRINYEKEKVYELLRKAERSDVVGNETKYLRKEELNALQKWKEVESKLLLQLARHDELVATLRDFVGPITSV